MAEPQVAVVMGSRSDWEVARHAAATLEQLGIPHEVRVLSAHRTPEEVAAYAEEAEGRGIRVLIAAAGGAAALPGALAARTQLPVLGVPVESNLLGLDSLLSMVQMPAGVPVGTLAVGRAGAVNAALLAAAILALSDREVRRHLVVYRERQKARVLGEAEPQPGSGRPPGGP